MKECKKIQEMLIDYFSDELTENEKKFTDAHLSSCEACQKEFQQLKTVYSNIDKLDLECESMMQDVDWERSAVDISRNARIKATPSSGYFSMGLTRWKTLAPLLTTVFVMGIWLGYVLFHSSPVKSFPQIMAADTDSSLSTLQTTLAKKEVVDYFSQSQLVLTDLMRNCDDDTMISTENWMNLKRAKSLLNKSRYFSQDLNNPQLLSSKELLKKIDWVLYEMLVMDEETSCTKLRRLQDFIQKERLLLKIRLMGKELAYSEV
jgi:hypothetical protein